MRPVKNDLSLDHTTATNTISAQAEELLRNDEQQAATLTAVHDTNVTMLAKLNDVQTLVVAQSIEQAVVPPQLAAFMATMEARTAFLDHQTQSQYQSLSWATTTRQDMTNALEQSRWQDAAAQPGYNRRIAGGSVSMWKSFECTCRTWTKSTAQQMNLGGVVCLGFSQREAEQHQPGCRLSRTSTRTRTNRASAQVFMSEKFIKAGFDFTSWTRRGFAEVNISPSFSLTVRNVVDRDVAPAYRVLDWYKRLRRGPLMSRERVLSLAISKIREIYDAGRGSPTNVDQHGCSLLHYFLKDNLIFLDDPEEVKSVIVALISSGLDVSHAPTCSRAGWPFKEVMIRFGWDVCEVLFADEAQDDACISGVLYAGDMDIIQLSCYLTERPEAFRFLTFEPLVEAILRNQPWTIEAIAREDPAALYKPSIFLEYSPLYLSITLGYCFPEVLAAILADRRLVNNEDRRLLEDPLYNPGDVRFDYVSSASHALRCCGVRTESDFDGKDSRDTISSTDEC